MLNECSASIDTLYCYLIEVQEGFPDSEIGFNPVMADDLRRVTTIFDTNLCAVQNWLEGVRLSGFSPWIECRSRHSALRKLIQEQLGEHKKNITVSCRGASTSRLFEILYFPDIELTHSLADLVRSRIGIHPRDSVLDYKIFENPTLVKHWANYVRAYELWVDKYVLKNVDDSDDEKMEIKNCLRLPGSEEIGLEKFKPVGSLEDGGFFVLDGVPLATLLTKCNGSKVTIFPAGGFARMPKLKWFSDRGDKSSSQNELVVDRSDFFEWLRTPIDVNRGDFLRWLNSSTVVVLLRPPIHPRAAANDEHVATPREKQAAQKVSDGPSRPGNPADVVKVSGSVVLGDNTLLVTAMPSKDGQRVYVHVLVDSPKRLQEGSHIALELCGVRGNIELHVDSEQGRLTGDTSLTISQAQLLSGKKWTTFVHGNMEVELTMKEGNW